MRGERFEHGELVGHLGTAEEAHQRALGFAHHAQVLELLAQQVTGHGPCDERHDARGRGVRAMRRAEGVVHVDVGERSELAREGRIVLLLFLVEAEVLEQQQLAVAKLLGGGADAVRSEGDRAPEQLGQTLRHRPQRELGLRRALRPAQMRGEHHAGAAGQQAPQRAERSTDARVVADAPARERHVQVGAHEDAPAAHAARLGEQVVERRNSHLATCPCGRRGRPRAWRSPSRCRTRRAPSRSCLPAPSCSARRRSTSAGCRRSPRRRAARPRTGGSP